MLKKFYRLSDDQPVFGQEVHCFTSLETFKRDVQSMRRSGVPAGVPGSEIKFWEVTGQILRPDDEDAVVLVNSSKEIKL